MTPRSSARCSDTSFEGSEIRIVGEAFDGAHAVEVVRETTPHVVLMDIVMPRMSGVEATVKIMKELPDVRIIACSTVDQNSMVLRALDAGCCNYVTKPFRAGDVLKPFARRAQLNSKEAGV